MAKPVVTLIAIVSEDGFISTGKGVPWNLPEDRSHYRRCTAGKWLLLGRTTYEEKLGGWFRDHTPLVLARDPSFKPPIGRRVATAIEAIDLAEKAEQKELVVCGGSAAFEMAMPHADRLILTRVAERLGSGVAFPEIDPRQWKITRAEPHGGNPPFRIEHLERRP